MKEFDPWLKMESDDSQGYCNYCKRSFSVVSRGISQVRQHTSGKVYISFENAANRLAGLIGSFLLPSSIFGFNYGEY